MRLNPNLSLDDELAVQADGEREQGACHRQQGHERGAGEQRRDDAARREPAGQHAVERAERAAGHHRHGDGGNQRAAHQAEAAARALVVVHAGHGGGVEHLLQLRRRRRMAGAVAQVEQGEQRLAALLPPGTGRSTGSEWRRRSSAGPPACARAAVPCECHVTASIFYNSAAG